MLYFFCSSIALLEILLVMSTNVNTKYNPFYILCIFADVDYLAPSYKKVISQTASVFYDTDSFKFHTDSGLS